jgi:hypothetical protein
MAGQERLVAVVSPWEKLVDLAQRQFRIESLPKEKKVMVWRDDLQSEQELTAALKEAGLKTIEVCRRRITDWKEVD